MTSPEPPRRGARARFAVAAMRAINGWSRRLGRGSGTVAGGRVGLAIDQGLLSKLLAGRDVVLVSGTNGKTTTTALVRAGLGRPTASNLTGANMIAGLVAALAEDGASTAVLEVDEPFLGAVMSACDPERARVVVLLNLSRDQLDRASEVRQLAGRWRGVLTDPDRNSGWLVVANVNDPLVAYAVEGASGLVPVAVPTSWRADAASCPACSAEITFEVSGSWTCRCGFRRPPPRMELRDALVVDGETIPMVIGLPGGFNRANAALAVAAAVQLGESAQDASERLAQVTEVAGRFEVRRWRGRSFRLMLAKNPAGVSALLEDDPPESGLVVAINANIADGRDPAWIYDAPFDRLAGRTVWCDGERALDIAVRLDYAGVATRLVADDNGFPGDVPGSDPVVVIANYTAFQEWHRRSEPC